MASLQDVRDSIISINFSTSQNLCDDVMFAATFGKRITTEAALNITTNLGRAFLQSLISAKSVAYSPNGESGGFRLVISKTGRLLVYDNDISTYQPNDSDYTLGWISTEEGFRDFVYEQYRELERRDTFYMTFINRQISLWERNNEIKGVISSIHDLLKRIETVFIYINERAFVSANLTNTTLEKWDNINNCDKNELLMLLGSPAHEFTDEEKILLVSIMCMYSLGGAQKIEELNGCNITPTALFRVIHDNYVLFGGTSILMVEIDGSRMSVKNEEKENK